MTQPRYSSSQTDPGSSTVPESAINEATDVGTSAASRARDVTEVVGEQTRQVASETGTQVRNLLDEGVNQLRGQARDTQRKLAEGLRDVADQLRRMSERSDDSGVAADLMRQATDRADQAASWLESREPSDLLEEVRRFAQRRPAMFLAGATLAGALAGRLTRNIVAATQEGGRAEPRSADPQPAPPAQPSGVPASDRVR